ncbi:MAG: aminoglycoside phosphotransferase family protein [Gemmatimonadetes bacterium]|nr:aminoglycoside phosphotransferase family protein [Gemmatimonadota bacterium]
MTRAPELVDEGWDNVTFRVGTEHAIRLPRRHAAVQLLENEQRWLPVLQSWIQLDVPTPVFRGQASDLFGWPWSVVTWVPGRTVEGRPLDGASARTLAAALRSLHRSAPVDAPTNPFRGIPLLERREVVEPRLARHGLGQLAETWARAIASPASPDRVWLHGDLHPRNVVCHEGGLRGIIDWGDLCAGDPATDLACAWTLFEAPERKVLLGTYGASNEERVRAAGWAVNFASGLVASAEPRHVPMGWDIVRRLSEPRSEATDHD